MRDLWLNQTVAEQAELALRSGGGADGLAGAARLRGCAVKRTDGLSL